MEVLALILVWPLLILSLGVVFVSASDIAGTALLVPIIIFLLIFLFGFTGKLGEAVESSQGDVKDYDHSRRAMIGFSIALLLPIFVKYLVAATQKNLGTIIIGLVIGFGAVVLGMFVKNNKVLTYANTLGGIFVIVYLYFQLWSLGQLAQIVAAAFGLIAAIVISVVKFKEKLT